MSESGWDRRRNLLLSEYERIALELFAERGFRNVTVDDIAAAAGVSARTLFRYFATKEDFLLTFPRRGVANVVLMIEQLDPSDDPFQAAWRTVRDQLLQNPPEVELLTLWRRAAADAPDVVARVRGERVEALIDAAGAYCASSLGIDPGVDVRPRLLAGILAGIELALVETWGRSSVALPDILADADEAMSTLGRMSLAAEHH